jgi:hypothetical protein
MAAVEPDAPPKEEIINVIDFFHTLKSIHIPRDHHQVEATVAREIKQALAPAAEIKPVRGEDLNSQSAVLNIAVVKPGRKPLQLPPAWTNEGEEDALLFHVDDKGCGWLLATQPAFLYLAWTHVAEDLLERDIGELPGPRRPAFHQEKSTFDLFLTQYARLIRNLDRERYLREYARLGFTHVEVNALAGPFPAEKGVDGEFYPDFYTYCPALDQFVSSRLNLGLYAEEYLAANRERLRENARLALKYGLTPGLLCFEPRSVPERFFERYPTLRGARVDHPFRSFKPRYNLSIAHPLVRKHYAELIRNLLREVPALEFLSIWTNDSGAGFEHTQSLYVGRNGGAYLIREWKDSDEIARAAAANAVRFFRLLRDAAREFNPRFRITTRLESFYAELPHFWPELGDGLDVEGNSLLAAGWEANYPHPCYSDIMVLGSALHSTLDEEERDKADELRKRGARCYIYHMFGSHTNHEPLLGIPFPWLTYEKLKAASQLGLDGLAHLGGIHPPDKVPYAVNQEVFRRFQLDPAMDIDHVVRELACNYAGLKYGETLAAGWRAAEEAVRAFVPLSIYSHYGAVWQRLLARPLVPDIGRIPEEERAYYEDFMCTSIHNPNRVDLAQDVLFELVTPEYAGRAVERIDAHVWQPLATAEGMFREGRTQASSSGDRKAEDVFTDQMVRIQALRCLYETLRNTALWVYAVHTFIRSRNRKVRERMQGLLNDMVEREIRNCRTLKELWETTSVEWMVVSGSEETPFIYAQNLGDLLDRKVVLMQKYGRYDPCIDPDFMFRVAGDP